MRRFVAALVGAFLATVSAAGAEDLVYVQSMKAKILANPSFQAEVVAVAARGDALSTLEKGPTWRKVRFREKAGWISNLLVGEKPPLARLTVLDSPNSETEPEARRRASATATAGASRGFVGEARRRTNQTEFSDYQALAQMESIRVNDGEVEAFIRPIEGGR